MAAKLANMPVGRNWSNPNSANLQNNNVTQTQAAEMLNVSPRNVASVADIFPPWGNQVIVQRNVASVADIASPSPDTLTKKDEECEPMVHKSYKKTTIILPENERQARLTLATLSRVWITRQGQQSLSTCRFVRRTPFGGLKRLGYLTHMPL